MKVNVENAHGGTGPRILVIGQARPVLETVMQELRDLGLAVEGTTQPDQALAMFDAANFDLVAIGGGISNDVRAAIKEAFAGQNPSVRLLDTYAPVAVNQIMDTLNKVESKGRVDLDAYFARIGYNGSREPTLDTLRALHELHPDAIAFEAIDVLLDRDIDISPKAIDAKLIGARRGGYCFEQNSLFKRVLEEIGFKVDGLSARVRWNAPAGAPISPRTHMALKVTIDGASWLADVGFGGCVMTTPLLMDVAEPQATQHESFRIFPFGPSLLVQACRDDAWLPLYELSRETHYEADYELANWFTAKHPNSPFRHRLIAARTTPDARYGLLDNRLSVRRPDGGTERQTLRADDIERMLTDVFRLPVAADWRPVIERAAATPA